MRPRSTTPLAVSNRLLSGRVTVNARERTIFVGGIIIGASSVMISVRLLDLVQAADRDRLAAESFVLCRLRGFLNVGIPAFPFQGKMEYCMRTRLCA
ncbi:hypothetical protein [Paenibacillus sp. CCS19]|uniref:hypothetical protein n=1 Tax=Paenibacillus sp. CCS19 TaxID=3158387 RepID=UPI00295EEB64|nr:hypothetical protein [Paenibacillus cellulosilyticus]